MQPQPPRPRRAYDGNHNCILLPRLLLAVLNSTCHRLFYPIPTFRLVLQHPERQRIDSEHHAPKKLVKLVPAQGNLYFHV